MSSEMYSEEWNATCGHRPASLRITSEVGAPFMTVSWIISILTVIIVPVGVILFAWGRTKWPYIRKRNFSAIIACAIGTLLSVVVGPMRDLIGREVFPCDVAVWGRIFAVVFMCVPVIYMLNFFRDQLLWSKALAAVSFQKLQDVLGENAEPHTGRRSLPLRIASTKITDVTAEDIEETGSEKFSAHSSIRMQSGASSFDESAFFTAMYKQSIKYKALVILLPFFPPIILGLALSFGVPFYGHGCIGCVDPPFFIAVLIGTVSILIVNVNWTAYHLKDAQDPLHIIGDLKLMLMGGSGLGVPGMIGVLLDEVIGSPYDRAVFSFDWLVSIAIIWFYAALCIVPVFKAYRDSRRVTSHRIDLKSLFNNVQFQKLFGDHLVGEWSIENLRFYKQVSIYRDHYSGFKSSKEANIVALQTFDTFIRPGAVMEVNISARLRERLLDEFKVLTHGNKDAMNTVQIEKDVFDEAQAEVFELMERDAFSRFQRTKEFQDFAGANLIADTTTNALIVAAQTN